MIPVKRLEGESEGGLQTQKANTATDIASIARVPASISKLPAGSKRNISSEQEASETDAHRC